MIVKAVFRGILKTLMFDIKQNQFQWGGGECEGECEVLYINIIFSKTFLFSNLQIYNVI